MIFSIIIPIYKTEKYINSCIQSVISQSFIDYECILVDDGSPDNCPSICDDFSRKDNRIKVIHKENSGPSEARNTGILYAAGEYLIFLDSDDKLTDNDAIKNLFDVIQEYKTDVITNANFIEFTDNGKRIIKNEFNSEIALTEPNVIIKEFNKPGMYLAGWSFVLKKDYLVKNNLFFKKGILHEDMHWWPRVLFKTKEIAVNHYPFYSYRVERIGSTMYKISSKRLFDLIDIINDLLTWSKEENNYQKEGCLYMREKARAIYYDIFKYNDEIKRQDRKVYYNIHKQLKILSKRIPNNSKEKYFLLSEIIGSYNMGLLYKTYMKIKIKYFNIRIENN